MVEEGSKGDLQAKIDTCVAADSSTAEQTVSPVGKQHFIGDKWIHRFGDDGPLYEHNGQEWKPVGENEADFLLQLWLDAEQLAKASSAAEGAEGVSDDLETQYKMAYGSAYDYSQMGAKEKDEAPKAEEKQKNEKPAPRPPGWVDMDEKVSAVYVSGLPLDATDQEFIDLMSKWGVIQPDARTGKPKIKLYKDEEGNNKGDGRCSYVKKESVELALNLLDGSDLRGKTIRVEKAHFEMKGEYDPKKKKRKLTAGQKKRYMEQQNRHFEWRPEKDRSFRPLSDCTVVIENLFTLEELNEKPGLLSAMKQELTESCEKFGVVKKVVFYENNADGVATVQFESTIGSDEAVKMLNGRPIKERKLMVSLWDGKAKYKVEESEEDARKRIEQWNRFLEGGEPKPDDASTAS